MRNSADDDQTPAQYHDVVIIGNGPSGITLSYILAGNWPYYSGAAGGRSSSGGGGGEGVPSFLHRKLAETPGSSLLELDLEHISEGVEGRSHNPVSVLFDALNHPGADLGSDAPPAVTWLRRPDRAVDHVVLGRGPIGGVWQKMAGDLLTVSLGSWMELPGRGFQQWCIDNERSRARVADVARYYADYVDTMGLAPHFRESTLVTSLRRLGSERSDAGLTIVPGSDQPIGWHAPGQQPLWLVEGFRVSADDSLQRFRYVSRRVALACGTSDVASRLGCAGENLPYVSHSLSAMEALLQSGRVRAPLLVVGAGLSAADVILAACARGVPVLHVFRRRATDRSLIFHSLPRALYPEYHQVHQMMRDGGRSCCRYTALAQSRVLAFGEDGAVTLSTPDGPLSVQVGHAAVMIGSRPNLDFVADATSLGALPGLPVDGKRNPLAVDAITHEAERAPGLYAMGPLVGDNFVRFLQGGALAIAAHINRVRSAERGDDSSSDVSAAEVSPFELVPRAEPAPPPLVDPAAAP